MSLVSVMISGIAFWPSYSSDAAAALTSMSSLDTSVTTAQIDSAGEMRLKIKARNSG